MKKNVLVIINPKAGVKRNKKVEQSLEKYLTKEYFDVEIYYTKAALDGKKYVHLNIDKNWDAVLVVGGDGTVNEIGSELVGTNIALGIIPMGSGNGLARYLDIPLKLEAAIERFSKFKYKSIDAGKINNLFFFNSLGFGIDALVSKKFSESKSRGLKEYVRIAAPEIAKPTKVNIDVEINGTTRKCEAVFFSIMNIDQFGNGFIVAPGANAEDGILDVVIIKKMPMTHIGQWLWKSFRGKPIEHKYIEKLKAEHLTIQNHQGFFQIDGEYIEMNGELKVSVIHNSLNVIC